MLTWTFSDHGGCHGRAVPPSMIDEWTSDDEARLADAYRYLCEFRDRLGPYGRAFHLANDAADRVKALMRDLHMTLP